jgi:hypothetical protein
VLATAWIEVECGRIRHIASCVVRHNCDVVTYLVLVRPALERVKGLTYLYVSRPGNTAIGAVGIEQLRIGVIWCVTRIQPYSIDSAVRSY